MVPKVLSVGKIGGNGADMDGQPTVLSPTDHDSLIRVETKLDNLNGLVTPMMNDHEKRIRSVEEIINTYNPKVISEKLDRVIEATTDSSINWKVVGIMCGFLAFAISAASIILAAVISKGHH